MKLHELLLSNNYAHGADLPLARTQIDAEFQIFASNPDTGENEIIFKSWENYTIPAELAGKEVEFVGIICEHKQKFACLSIGLET